MNIAEHGDFFPKNVKRISKIPYEKLLNLLGRRGARECKSDSSNEFFVLPKTGFNTADNEFSTVCQEVVRQVDRLS